MKKPCCEEKKEDSCCGPKKDYNGNSKFKALMYGLLPHTGCILFVLAAVLGSTALMTFFKPLLMDRNIFYYLIGISIGFATLSSFFYLKKNKALNIKGIKKKKSYLATMYGITVGINLVLFFVVFPLTVNLVGASIITDGLSSFDMEVDIPCPGHAPLINSEVTSIEGVEKVEYGFPESFTVYYDETQTSKKEILELEVFIEYPATITNVVVEQSAPSSPSSLGSCSGGCGGTSNCGGSCGSPTCDYSK